MAYKLIVTLPYDESFHDIQKQLITHSYVITYMKTPVGPDLIQIIFSNLGIKFVDEYKNFFRENYKNNSNKSYCSFKIGEGA